MVVAMSLKLRNNAVGVLSNNVNTSQTNIVLSAGHGDNFPALSSNEWFPLTVVRPGAGIEIMRVTGRSGDVLTVERGQEGTMPREFQAGDRAEMRLTVGALNARLAMQQDELNFVTPEQLSDEFDEKLAGYMTDVPGVIMDYVGITAPAGWLFCAGQAVLIDDYPRLFDVLGSRFGGDGVTTFGIPDLRGRVAAGRDDMGGTAAGRLQHQIEGTTLGARGGLERHVLTVSEMPKHAHGISDPGHNHGINDPKHAHAVADPGHAHVVHDPGHVHPMNRENLTAPSGSQTRTTGPGSITTTGLATTGIWIDGAYTGIGIHTSATGITIQSKVTGVSVQESGSGLAHNNLQPTFITNKIIRT